jgi:hypothetical protein
MWPPTSQLNLIRYLVAWRVNGAFVQLPRCLPAEMSRVLGTLIAERLPTPQAKVWRKALGPDDRDQGAGTSGTFPAWPIESVIWPYPGKRAYGQGELLLWELKLLGDAADHGMFLEVILPAMEVAATTADERWHQPRTLWGRFDIQAVHIARGPHWEPVVTDGRLDLAYRATSTQWAAGRNFEPDAGRRGHKLNWLTPFDFGILNAERRMDDAVEDLSSDKGAAKPEKLNPPASIPRSTFRVQHSAAPSQRGLLDALMARAATLTLGKWATAEQAWAAVGAEEQMALWSACDEGCLKRHTLEPAPRDWPGRWIGAQSFTKISPHLLPYLELASILHIGKHTHLGCGTFALE